MYSFNLVVFITISILKLISSTTVNGGQPISCSRAEVTEVRIQGCQHEPCTLKKGTNLPLSIDLSFQFPKSMKEPFLSALLAYWNVPGTGVYGSYLVVANDCSKLQLQCPAKSGVRYTLKTNLYADPRLQSSLGGATTGKVTTFVNLQLRDDAVDGPDGNSSCGFNLDLVLVQ